MIWDFPSFFSVSVRSLRAVETETQGWIQFETGEYILDQKKRDQVKGLVCPCVIFSYKERG